MGAEALWPIFKALAIVAVVLGTIGLIIRQIRKGGGDQREVEIRREQGERNDNADEIMAEPTGDSDAWLDRMRDD